MNNFYNQNRIYQWAIALLMLCALGLIIYCWISLISQSVFAMLLLFIITPAVQFLSSPFLTLTGVYTYLSPMLLVFTSNEQKYELHNGTSFDYLFCFQWKLRGAQWQNILLLYYIDGLLQIIHKTRQNEVSQTLEIRGSSYFFSDRTAKRLGFELLETSLFDKLNIIVNYLDLAWMYSLSKGGIHFPALSDIKTVSTTAASLQAKENELLKLQAYLRRKNRKCDVVTSTEKPN